MPDVKKESKMVKAKSTARFGSGMLANSIKVSEKGKIDCYGIFTIFHAWAYPANRAWHAAITLFNLQKGTSSITISLKRKPGEIIKTLSTIDFKIEGANGVVTIPVPLKHRFLKPGTYILECSIRDSHSKLRIPFEVRTMDWPSFTEEEIQFGKDNANIPKSLRANVHCDKCEHVYIFEETFLPELEIKGGIRRFPESGKFECEECGNILYLKDIQGQLRTSLKDILSQNMQGLS